MHSSMLIPIHLLTHGQLIEGVRRLREEMQQISDDRARLFDVRPRSSSGSHVHPTPYIVVILVVSVVFFLRNM